MADLDLFKNSEDQYRSIFEHMINGAALHKVVTDEKGKPVNYVFLEVNSAFERLTGLKGKEVIGKNVTDVLPGIENDPANWIAKYGNVGLGGKAISFEDYSEPLKKWFSIHSYCPMEGYFVCIFEDITKRKEIELSLAESEKFNKSLLNSSPDIIYIYSIVESKNIYSNKGISDLLGYSPEDILEMGSSLIALLMHPGDFKSYKKHILPRYQSLIDKELLEHEYRMKHRNGKWFWIQSRESIYQRDKDGNPTQVFGIMADITERKLNEEKIKISEGKFRYIYENSPDMYVSVSPEDATINQCNNTLVEKTGYSREEIIGSKVFKLYHEDSIPAAEKAFKQFVEKGEINNEELILKRKNGSKIHVSLNVSSVRDVDGKILHSISSWRDIGDKLLSREKVLQEKNKAQQYLDVAGVMLVGLDKDGVVQLINRKGCEVLGYSEEEIIGKDWIENFLPKRVRKAVKEVSKKVFADEIESLNYYENEILTKTKEEKIIAWYNEPLRDEKGNITGTLSSGEDITSRKQMEKELKNSEIRYKTLYKNAPLPYHSLDEGGCFIEINPAWLETLGYERKEVIGKYYGDFLHPDSKDHFRKKFPQFKKSGHVHTTFKIRHKDGRYLDIGLSGSIDQNLDGSFKQSNCVFQDITAEIKSREELLKNQFYLSKSQEIGTIGTWEIDLRKNTILWTEENYKIFGVPFGTEMNYDLFLKCIHPDDRDFVDAEWTAATKGKSYDIEHRILLGKEVKWVREKADFQFDEEGNCNFAIGVTQDITTRKEAEEQIRESEEKYRALYENAPLPYQSLNENGTFGDVNPAWLRTLGYTRDEVIGKNYADFLHPEWIGHFEKNFPEFIKRGYVNDVQFKIRHKKGHYLDISFEGCIGYHPDGSFKQTYCVFQDITERKESERLLVENEHKFRLLVENTEDWEYWMNEKNEYVFSSPSCEQITGYSTEDLYRNSALFLELVHPEHRDNVVKHYLHEEQNDLNSTYSVEFKIVAKDGIEKWIEHICKPVYNDKNEFIGRRGKNRDITLRENAVEELKIAKNKAEEADKLKSAFLANMSHEIRTPMNGIMGFTNLLKKPNLSGEKKQDYIEIIRKSGNRMLKTVNDIIEISKIETGQVGLNIGEVNLSELCEYLYLFFKPEAEVKQLQLNLLSSLKDHQSVIRTDEVKLNSILTNLIKNAIKYSNEGSIEVGCKVNDKFLEYYIKDTGIGIPEERMDAIFDRFVQADIEDRHAYEGSGLGLAIAKSYVEMLGGSIWLESKVGSGTTVHFTIEYLPLKTKVRQADSNDMSKSKKSKSKKVILVAEDDEVSYLLLENILPPENYTLLWAKNGKEAINLFKNTKGIDFILMDLKMPVMDGLEATRQIKKLNSKIPIIAQTAYAMDSDREKAIEAGCDDYITKPIEYASFEKMINEYI
jgi:PAS domain S-box-containing protein